MLAMFPLVTVTAADKAEVRERLTASEAFVRYPAHTLTLLKESKRQDMIDYYKADSIADVMNSMEGLSHLIRPVTSEWLKVQVTPVTTLTIRVLPYKQDGQIVMSVYTIGDSLQASDSEVRFYDEKMTELKRDKFIKIARSEDFFDFRGTDGKTKKEILELVPFPTVEYINTPDGTGLTARLTVGEFMSKEDMEKISPYLRRERQYRWTGNRYELVPFEVRR